jgi:hypothetical protein
MFRHLGAETWSYSDKAVQGQHAYVGTVLIIKIIKMIKIIKLLNFHNHNNVKLILFLKSEMLQAEVFSCLHALCSTHTDICLCLL